MKFLALSSILLVTLVAVKAQVSVSNSDSPCFPCDPSWPRPLYYPNYDDCNTVWECKNGELTLTNCEGNTVFDFLLQACATDGPELMFTCNKLIHRI